MLMAVEGSSWLSREVTGKNKQEKDKQHLKVSILCEPNFTYCMFFLLASRKSIPLSLTRKHGLRNHLTGKT